MPPVSAPTPLRLRPPSECGLALGLLLPIVALSAGCETVTTTDGRRSDVVSLGQGVSMTLVEIPAGSFTMGSAREDDQEDETPQVEVIISQALWIGKTEVTQAQWRAVMGSDRGHFSGDPTRPVEMVSWNDAQEFCRRLSERTGSRFRLPTEAEWEHACRAGSSTRFYFGDDATPLGEHAWTAANSGQEILDAEALWAEVVDKRDAAPMLSKFESNQNQTHPVGSKLPNPWGLHDMVGNVWEWCEDWYLPGYYLWLASDPPRTTTDPVAPLLDDPSYRVIRGGGWESFADQCRSADRKAYVPHLRGEMIGFRVVRAP